MTFHEESKHAVAQEGSNSEGTSSHKKKLPPIPDLRFEYSYLKSVQPFVKITRSKVQEVQEAKGAEAVDDVSAREIIAIEWRRVLWVTLKDQVISPLLQGALWGFGSSYLRLCSACFGFGGTKSIIHGRKRDGEGVSWLRQKLGFRNNAQPASRSTT